MSHKSEDAVNARTFEAAIDARKRKVAHILHRLNLDDDLTRGQAAKLAQIVLRYDAGFRQFRYFSKNDGTPSETEAEERLTERDVRLDRRQSASQRRMFSRKMRTAIAAIERALTYAKDEPAFTLGPFTRLLFRSSWLRRTS